MTDRLDALSSHHPIPSQTVPILPPGPAAKDEAAHKVETVEEEPYTIKCICNFSGDDGNTIYCETCDTWQHIECFYPDNREEAIREDFAHACAECNPRPLNRHKAIERAHLLRDGALAESVTEKKSKRPPSKSHKKKPKPSDSQANGILEGGKHGSPSDHAPKKSKSSHRHSQSTSSQHPKRSPSYSSTRPNHLHPPSPATSPPDLPEDFQIHHYSAGFCALYKDHNVSNTENNNFASLAIPTALSRWLREPETMKEEVGRTHSDVFQDLALNAETKKPVLEVQDAQITVDSSQTLQWRYLRSATPVEKDVPLIELNGEIGFQKDYCSEAENLWADLSSPLPFVFFHPVLPLYIDTRKEGSQARYVRRSCKPNAQLDTYLDGSEYHFWLVSDRYIAAHEQITLPWDFRLEKSVGPRWLHLLGLSDDDSHGRDEPEMDDNEYTAISNWIDRILSEYGGCACDLENNCAFARFHRHYLYGRSLARPNGSKKKQRRSRAHTISPTSTGHPSRAASEGHLDDGLDDTRSQSGSSRSKPSSRDPTPMRQGSLDRPGILTEPTDRDKRKVAMVEDSFRRMEQQQPVRKKKRVSDGTSSSKSRQRHDSSSHGQYVDAGAGLSNSGSPAAVSPSLWTDDRLPGPQSVTSRSRQHSMNPRTLYCDAAIQTDTVEGEWFSLPATSPTPRKKVIPLAKRLLESRRKLREDEERRRRESLTPRRSSGSAMEIDPVQGLKVLAPSERSEAKSPTTSHADDLHMSDAPADDLLDGPGDSAMDLGKSRTPELRVQMPPVPAFDHSGAIPLNGTTPSSATSSMVQSPFSTANLPSPFGPHAMNGAATQPSPAKKKLSLSDYTKRSMSKAAGKVSGGTAVLKSTLPSPEETKVDISLEPPIRGKPEASLPSSNTTTNGHL